jgi:2,4-dienoyl-CoA reductase (NADPH2)
MATKTNANKGEALYPRLLAPLKVAHLTLKNRVIMGSMHTGLESAPDHTRKEAAYYAARARGEAGLIITGGIAPNADGLVSSEGGAMYEQSHIATHRPIVDAVHEAGGVICMQILHSGRYLKRPNPVAPSPIRSPINPNTPRALTEAEIEQTIQDFANCAVLAKEAGYDGVEVMGSEGYLINQFTVLRTNQRTDSWGGSVENRHKFPVEIVKRVRAAVGRNFILVYRISALDLVEGGAEPQEILVLAKRIEAAGADIMNTGIGWHEARVPTIAYPVPRAAWAAAPARIKQVVKIPVVASNRINTPEVAEDILAKGQGDMISLARPMLADPDFVAKARQGRSNAINTCIACNQACLDYIFTGRVSTCLVNPRACREIEFEAKPATKKKKIAVVGGGAAGMSFAAEAAERGHAVTLFEAADTLGGQLNLARRIPGKSEFNEMIRSFRTRLWEAGVTVKLGTKANAVALKAGGFDEVVIAVGIEPRKASIPGIDHAKVVTYTDIITGKVKAGRCVAIIGSGGIGFDVAHTLAEEGHVDDAASFYKEWAVDMSWQKQGGLAGDPNAAGNSGTTPARTIVMLQRGNKRPGGHMGVSTGWIIKGLLKKRNVQNLTGVAYEKIDDAGLHITVDGKPQTIPADTIVACAGQTPNRTLANELEAAGLKPWLIGGAKEATELDALRAVEDGLRLALAM